MMSRPVYETDIDLENESEFAGYFYGSGRRLQKLNPIQYCVDFAIVKQNEVVGFVEYKRRQVESTAYPDIILALSKYLKLVELSKLLPTAFFVQFNDKLMFLRIGADHTHQVSLAGRKDRGDEYDLEPCVRLPMAGFRDV